MPQSYIEYSSGLAATTFSVPFKYLNIDDVNVVGYNGVSWTPLTIASRSEAANTVTLSVAPSAYNKIRVYRQSTSNQLVDFQAGARLTESELDTAYNQSLFVAQEVSEDANTNQFKQIRDASTAVGNSLSNFASQAFTANSGGTQTEFSLTAFTPETTVPEAFLVSIDGVIQSPTDAYTISRSPAKVTLTSAAPANAKVVIVTTASAAGSAANLFLNTDGKVGIGTTNPNGNLHVGGATGSSQNILTLEAIQDSGSRFMHIRTPADMTSANSPFEFFTSNAFKFVVDSHEVVINSSGNVGIGTTSPSEALEVVGKIIATNGTESVELNNTGSIELRHASNAFIDFKNGSEDFDSRILSDADGLAFSTGGSGLPPSRRMTIDSNGNVGIGTTSPSSKLEVAGDVRANNIVGRESNNGIIIKSDPESPNGTNGGSQIELYSQDFTATRSQIYHKARYSTFQDLTPTDIVTIGSQSNTNTLKVTGNIQYTGTISDISDSRLKENVEPLTGSLDKICQLEAKSYTMVDDEDKTEELGFIAQDVQQIFPNLVKESTNEELPEDERGDPFLNVAYIQLIAPMVEAIKELKSENESLKARVEALENA
jgi:hypothetical protein